MSADNSAMPREEHWRQRLVELMAHLGVTQVAFSQETGIDPTYVSRLLYPPEKKGRKNLGLDTMRAICSAYRLPLDWFDKEIGSGLPSPGLAQAQQPDGTPPLLARDSDQTTFTRPWPFPGGSYQRLMALKPLMGRDFNAALRDIEEQLESAIVKWELRAAAKKGQRKRA